MNKFTEEQVKHMKKMCSSFAKICIILPPSKVSRLIKTVRWKLVIPRSFLLMPLALFCFGLLPCQQLYSCCWVYYRITFKTLHSIPKQFFFIVHSLPARPRAVKVSFTHTTSISFSSTKVFLQQCFFIINTKIGKFSHICWLARSHSTHSHIHTLVGA